MRIGYDATNILGHGGIKTYARELVTALAAEYASDRFVLLTTSNAGKVESIRRMFRESSNVEVCPGLPHSSMLGDRLGWMTSIIGRLAWSLRERHLDVVHLTDPYGTAALPGRDFVATIHDLFPLTREEHEGSALQRRYLRRTPSILHKATSVIIPSRYVGATLRELYPFATADIRTVPDAAGETFRPRERDMAALSRIGLLHERFFVFVGRADPRKNIHGLLEGYMGLQAEVRAEVVMVLVLSGELGDLTDAERELVAISGAVVLRDLGDEDLAMLYSSADALVFPTLDEGFGLPVLEAMQCGCPVVTSSRSSLPEVTGGAALLIDPDDPSTITSALREISESGEMRLSLSSAGVERASLFSWSQTARGTMDAYLHAHRIRTVEGR